MNSDTVQYLADLARLDIPENEKEGLIKDLESMIGFIDRIQQVEINTATNQAAQAINVFRDDVVSAVIPVYDLVECAPDHQDHFVKVPKVFE